MDKKFSLGIVVCMMISGVIVAGCASARSVAQDVHLIPTPEGAIPMPSCDEPTWIVGEQEVCRFLVTPLPDEKVRVGTSTQVAPSVESQQQSRYTIREDIPPWQPVTEPGQIIPVKKLFVHNTETGQDIRLGDDAGHALFRIMTSEYVIWRYQWNGRSETSRKTGLYVYVLETGEEIVVARQPDADPWYPEIDGQWVLYVDGQNASKHFSLYVHNLATGEDFLLGNQVPHYGVTPSDYYAINGNQIAWIETEGGWTVHIYDLATRTMRLLDVPNTSSPGNPSISESIVVWFDKFWRGYDLEQDVLFTIPTVPPGWENISVQPASPVTVKDNQLYWALEVNDEVYRFTAPIIRN
ncbi:MAG: hypothetical protein SXV54_26260 [Chloroflexota bacterium]|nr:hypothetical protein [Chloroflexota bacterium]